MRPSSKANMSSSWPESTTTSAWRAVSWFLNRIPPFGLRVPWFLCPAEFPQIFADYFQTPSLDILGALQRPPQCNGLLDRHLLADAKGHSRLTFVVLACSA